MTGHDRTEPEHRTPRPLAVIGVPTSAGAFAPGQEAAPAALRNAGLIDRLSAAGLTVIDRGDSPPWRWQPDRERPDAQNLAVVAAQIRSTSSRVQDALSAGQIPLVLGGDCTIELGVVAGFLASGERVALLYFDKHADLNVPAAVPEGALDWMGLAHLLGEADALPELSRLGPRCPMLAAEDVLIFGHRIERATAYEQQALQRRGLETVSDVDAARDPEGTAVAALDTLLTPGARLLIHFDVDVIDFTDAPLSEETGRNEGLTLEQAFRALRVFTAHPAFAALTITELNPNHGEADGATLDRFVSDLVEALRQSAPIARTAARG